METIRIGSSDYCISGQVLTGSTSNSTTSTTGHISRAQGSSLSVADTPVFCTGMDQWVQANHYSSCGPIDEERGGDNGVCFSFPAVITQAYQSNHFTVHSYRSRRRGASAAKRKFNLTFLNLAATNPRLTTGK